MSQIAVGGNFEVHTNLPIEAPPKCTCELWILIRYNNSWQPVVPPPSFEKRLCNLERGCSSHKWHHVCQLGKPLNHQEDGTIPLWLWQTCDQIHAQTMPWPRRYRQQLQEANLLFERGSVYLALHLSLHKVGYILLYALPIIPPWHHSMVVYSLSFKAGNETHIFPSKQIALTCLVAHTVAHLFMRSAQNTMGTKGTLEWHPSFVAPLVRGPKWS